MRDIARRFARAKLHYGHGTHNAMEEAAWLVSSVLGLPLNLEEKLLSRRQKTQIESLALRRIRGRIPLAYLLRQAWLGEHCFYVDRRAIVPRSFIAELLRDRLGPWLVREPTRVLDLCTGSGCLAVLIALTFRKTRVTAADLSKKALEVARINIRKYRLGKRIRAVRSDLFQSLGRTKYELIVCNPPYVTARSMRNLPREYRREPVRALAGGKDGLAIVHRIIAGARDHLAPNGMLVCEIGGNRQTLEKTYPELPFIWPETSAGPGCVFILERERLPARRARMGAASGTQPTRARARR